MSRPSRKTEMASCRSSFRSMRPWKICCRMSKTTLWTKLFQGKLKKRSCAGFVSSRAKNGQRATNQDRLDHAIVHELLLEQRSRRQRCPRQRSSPQRSSLLQRLHLGRSVPIQLERTNRLGHLRNVCSDRRISKRVVFPVLTPRIRSSRSDEISQLLCFGAGEDP